MRAYVIRRLLVLIPTLLIVTLLIFFLTYLMPGDAIDAMLAVGGVEEEIDSAMLELAKELDIEYDPK